MGRSGRRQAIRWAVGLAVAALSIVLLAHGLDWAALRAALVQAQYGRVLAGVLLVIASFFARTWRWRALLGRPAGRTLTLMGALLTGQALNSLLPMRGGDVVRAAWASDRARIGLGEALASIAAEKASDLLALLGFTLALFLVAPLPQWLLRSAGQAVLWLALGTGLVGAALCLGASLARGGEQFLARLPAGWERRVGAPLRQAAQGLRRLAQPRRLAAVLLWTLATWGIGAAVNLALLAAFGIYSPAAALFLLVALMLGNAAPVPAGLGLFEGICVLSLALFGVPRDRALAVGLVLHAVVLGPPLVGAALLAVGSALKNA
ncbi:MAG: flippase-like domain-containing protein [Anaerolineae bacterium]|nr:flippase-like domain-containing protein [Anaerolineae bacterium]